MPRNLSAPTRFALQNSEVRKAGRPDGPALPRRRFLANFSATQILSCEKGGNRGTLKLGKGQNCSEREFEWIICSKKIVTLKEVFKNLRLNYLELSNLSVSFAIMGGNESPTKMRSGRVKKEFPFVLLLLHI